MGQDYESLSFEQKQRLFDQQNADYEPQRLKENEAEPLREEAKKALKVLYPDGRPSTPSKVVEVDVCKDPDWLQKEALAEQQGYRTKRVGGEFPGGEYQTDGYGRAVMRCPAITVQEEDLGDKHENGRQAVQEATKPWIKKGESLLEAIRSPKKTLNEAVNKFLEKFTD